MQAMPDLQILCNKSFAQNTCLTSSVIFSGSSVGSAFLSCGHSLQLDLVSPRSIIADAYFPAILSGQLLQKYMVIFTCTLFLCFDGHYSEKLANITLHM